MINVISDTSFLIHLATHRIKNIDSIETEIGTLSFIVPKIVKKEDLRIESENRRGVFYYEGEKVGVRYLDGFYFRTNAILTTVIESYGEGAVLKTSDGSYWKVPEYDQYDTGWWLPPYDALIQNELYLINLKKGKKVWVSRTD